MTASDSTPTEGQDSIDGEIAREVAREATATMVADRSLDVSDAASRLETALRDGEDPTEAVEELRREVDGLRYVTETYAVRLTDLEAWEHDGDHLRVGQLVDRYGADTLRSALDRVDG